MKKTSGAYLELHFVVLLLGFTGILGKLIVVPALQLVIMRMMIAFLGLLFITRISRISFRLSGRILLQSLGVGLIVAAHWFCFFQAIKISNVSIALGLLGTGTLFTAFLEPMFMRKKMSGMDVLIALVILVGIYLIFRFESGYFWGILTAIAAYFLSSLFSVMNKKLGEHGDVRNISMIEMVSGIIVLSIAWAVGGNEIAIPTPSDWFFVILLGSVCTAYAFTATIRLMQRFSAYLVVLHINLEPVYAIILAYFIFGESEKMTWGFYVGSAIVTAAVFFYTFASRIKARNKDNTITA